jgi:diguanylate cyclase (GGDEF)-like protein
LRPEWKQRPKQENTLPLSLSSERLRAIIETQTEIAAADLDLEIITDLIVRRGQRLTAADAGVMEIVDGDEMIYAVVSGSAAPFLGVRLKAGSSLSGLCVASDEVLYSADTAADDRVDSEAVRRVGAASMACVPLRHGAEVVGVLKVYAGEPGAFAHEDLVTLRILGVSAAAHMAHAQELAESAEQSRIDPLTGLHNRRAYDERLQVEAARARRRGHPLSLCLLDLDGFKRVNDEFGHPAGDAVLKEVAGVLSAFRSTDDCFRVGGDEFAVLMPETTSEDAATGAARVQKLIAEAGLGPSPVSATAGIACTFGDGLILHENADRALIEEKARKRAGSPVSSRR